MNKHRDIKFVKMTFRVPKEFRDGFMGMVDDHKTTSCHVFVTTGRALIKGSELGVVDLAAKNPLIIQMQSFFGARPRGHGKYKFYSEKLDPLTGAVRCRYLRHHDWNVGRLGWCRDIKMWVTPDICLTCVKK